MQQLSIRIAAAAVLVGVVTACGAQDDTARQHAAAPTASAPSTPLDTVAGLPVSDGPSGPRDGVPLADIPVDNASGEEVDVLAINAIADLEAYWKVEFPMAFRSEFVPVSRYLSWDSSLPEEQAPTFCGTNTAGYVNAGYCFSESPASIGWDRVLLGEQVEKYGPMAAVFVLAHEYGHAIQFQASLISPETSSISVLVSEQQADCLTGAYIRNVAEGKSARFELNTTDGLSSVLGTAVSFGDYIDGPTMSEHGSGFERVSAVKRGFTDGPSACAAISAGEIAQRRGDLPQILSGPEDDGQAPVDRDTVGAMLASLQRAFPMTDPPTIEYAGTDLDCPAGALTEPVSYCAATDTIGVDLSGLSERAGHMQDADAFALIASRYALAVQHREGRAVDDPLAGLRAACLTGAWAAASISDPEIQLSAGDLDEIVFGLLQDGLVASDVNGDSAPSGFTRVEALQTGVLQGTAGCDTSFT